MADDGITDAELREQLQALGQNPGPITATTRKLWLNKLVNIKSNTQKMSKMQAPSRKLIGFSSDESEPESAALTAVPKSGRGRGRPTGKPSRVSARSRAKNSKTVTDINKEETAQPSPPSLPFITARPPIRSRSSAAKLELESDDVIVKKELENSSNNKGKATPSATVSSRSRRIPVQQKITRYSASWSKPPIKDSETNDFDSSDSDVDSSVPELHSMAVNTSPSLDISFPEVPSGISFTRNRLGLGDSLLSDDNTPKTLSRRSTRTSKSRTIDMPGANSLSSNKHNDLSSNRPRPTTNLKQSLRPSKSKTKAKTTTAPSEEENFIQHGFKVNEEDPRIYKYSQYCSVLIVLVVLIFFIVLGGLYLKVRQVDKPKVCGIKPNEPDCPPLKDPVKECDAKLWDYLSKHAGDVECGYVVSEHGKRIRVEEVKKAVSCGKHWKGVIEDIFKNRAWKIMAYQVDLSKANRFEEVAWLESELLQMPLMCRLKRAYDRFIFVLYMVIACAAVIFVGVSIVKFRKRRREEASQRVIAMVEKIIDVLKQHHDEYEQNKLAFPYVAILHARDMLIPIKDRKKLQKVWDEAVKFLEANESRVRVETQTISGEEFSVWRWLQGLPNGGKSRVWQGQAFGENAKTGMYKVPYSPTPCLKVRNMFDADIEYGDDWHIYIQDAILEKCADTCPDDIYHIAVDKDSTEGCVYIKCSCPEAAGKVYAALHGWWFDGNLVTVKYIRLERYYERFPYARAAMLPMQPSNDEMKSMAQPYHRSALERS